MRISDWSSDVCSSDLAHCAQWEEQGDASARPRLAKVIAATATISDPDRQLRVLYQRESLRFPCPGPGLYESFYSAPREPLRPERSEEHTSELQSLMRTSYAVFCLTKKTR